MYNETIAVWFENNYEHNVLSDDVLSRYIVSTNFPTKAFAQNV